MTAPDATPVFIERHIQHGTDIYNIRPHSEEDTHLVRAKDQTTNTAHDTLDWQTRRTTSRSSSTPGRR